MSSMIGQSFSAASMCGSTPSVYGTPSLENRPTPGTHMARMPLSLGVATRGQSLSPT